MTNFIDHKISTPLNRSFRRVVVGKTDIVPLENGSEARNAAWKYKKMRFTASYAMLDYQSQQEITSAFYAANAQLLLFRFRDPGDFIVTDSPLVTGPVLGTRNPLQLTKRYTFGSVYADRMIQAVNTCVVTGPGGPVAGVFDKQLGLFTPTSNWGSGTHTWSGTFDCWVRFNSDEFDSTLEQIDLAVTDIELIEGVAKGDESGS